MPRTKDPLALARQQRYDEVFSIVVAKAYAKASAEGKKGLTPREFRSLQIRANWAALEAAVTYSPAKEAARALRKQDTNRS